MTQGEENLEEIVKEAKKGIFRYSGIDPKASFDEREFLIHFNHFSELKGYEDKIKKATGNLDAGIKGDITGLLFGDKKIGPALDDMIIRDAAKEGRKFAQKGINQYTQNNFNALFAAIENDEEADGILQGLAFSTPLYYIGNESHDKVVKAIREVGEASKAAQAAQQGDIGKMQKIVLASVKNKDIPSWGVKLLQKYINDERFVQMSFQGFLRGREQVALAYLTKDGKMNGKRIRSLIEDSLKEAWRLHAKETDEGKQGDIYDDGIAPIYQRIAESAYGPIAKSYQSKLQVDHKEVEDMRKRAEERAKAGVGVPMTEVPDLAEKYR